MQAERQEARGYPEGVVAERQGVSVVAVLSEDDHRSEVLRVVPHEAGVVGEHHDVAFVSGVEEDDSVAWTPVVSRHQDSLLEGCPVNEREVVQLVCVG